jgi:hypothetical protein
MPQPELDRQWGPEKGRGEDLSSPRIGLQTVQSMTVQAMPHEPQSE